MRKNYQRQQVLSPVPPKSAKDILALLLASAGFSLAARKDANIELLPGHPTTVIVIVGGKAQAVFVLPISEAEASKLTGQDAPTYNDDVMNALWEEERINEMTQPDDELFKYQDETWSGEYAN